MVIAEEQIGGLTLLQSPEEFQLTRDALALVEFAGVKKGDRVCDLGCGVGNLLIPLGARAQKLALDGVELRESAAALCRESLRRRSLTGTIVASMILVPLPEILRFGSVQEWRMVFYGLLVVLVIIFKPSGLMVTKEFSIQGMRDLGDKAKKKWKER